MQVLDMQQPPEQTNMPSTTDLSGYVVYPTLCGTVATEMGYGMYVNGELATVRYTNIQRAIQSVLTV